MIQHICLDDVLSGKFECNTNNHWIEPPNDYKEILEKTNTRHWIDSFHDNYQTITLHEYDLQWMSQAFKIGTITKRFPNMYKDQLQTKHQPLSQKYFVRTETASLKYGIHGVGPYTNLTDIIESMVTTTISHRCFNPNDKMCKIYLIPWIDNVDDDKEFRIFVHNKTITAISQQHVYIKNTWLPHINISTIIQKILSFFEKDVKHKIDLDHYVIDLAFIQDTIIFIEANSFGQKYASGSALFHWIHDHDLLYNEKGTITLRYC